MFEDTSSQAIMEEYEAFMGSKLVAAELQVYSSTRILTGRMKLRESREVRVERAQGRFNEVKWMERKRTSKEAEMEAVKEKTGEGRLTKEQNSPRDSDWWNQDVILHVSEWQDDKAMMKWWQERWREQSLQRDEKTERLVLQRIWRWGGQARRREDNGENTVRDRIWRWCFDAHW